MPSESGQQAVKAEIAREIEQVHLESYGQPVHDVVVELSERFIALVMDIALSPAERTLISGGKKDSVRSAREAYQHAIEPTFKAIVERASGRRVEGFASRTVIETEKPSWSAEVFRLATS